MTGFSRSKGAIFLIEFLIMLLVFSLACVVALRLFAKTDELESRTLDADNASAIAVSLSTYAKEYAGGGMIDPKIIENGGDLTAYFDSGCELCSESEAAYLATAEIDVTESAGGRLVDGEIAVCAVGSAEPIYTLAVCEFHPYAEAAR